MGFLVGFLFRLATFTGAPFELPTPIAGHGHGPLAEEPELLVVVVSARFTQARRTKTTLARKRFALPLFGKFQCLVVPASMLAG